MFEKEIYVWSKLHHPNILPLIGFAFCGETGFPMIISEWMAAGTLRHFIDSATNIDVFKARSFVRSQLLSLIFDDQKSTLVQTRDIANGLAYIHEKEAVHSDIKSVRIVR